MTVLSQNILRLRKELKLSQTELANEFNELNRTAVSAWESATAQPCIENIIRLADIFGVTIDDLLLNNKAKTQNHFNDDIKLRLVKAWNFIDQNNETAQDFYAWKNNEKVEFLLTTDAYLSSGPDSSPRDKALKKALAGNSYGKKAQRKRKPIIKIASNAGSKKQSGG